ncbi:MAG TPA: aspartate kinase [Anaerolineae bacterium]|nr:aspartate kinase [Anaerolineae bacterium]
MSGKTLIIKFGGTSVGSAAAIAQAAEIVRDARKTWPQVVVVVSAMSGVTNALLEGAQAAARGEREQAGRIANQLKLQHLEAVNGLIESEIERIAILDRVGQRLQEFDSLCDALAVLGEATPRALDAVASLGERMSNHLVAGRLRQIGVSAEAVNAADVIRTDSVFQSAAPLMEITRQQAQGRLGGLLAEGAVPVVTGFIGATESGVITTLGRGASDYTAAILGDVLDGGEVWIYTDVDGVMTADPRVVPEARSLATLSYREMSELAYFGAKVLHPKSVTPIVERGIPLRIKNTFNPAHPGTLVLIESNGAHGALKGVTAIKQQSLITIEGRGMLGVPGIAARAFGAVARTRTSVPMISQASSEQSICFLVPDSSSEQALAQLRSEFERELARRDIEAIWAMSPVVIVTVVGAAMRSTPGVAGRVFSALGTAGINIIAIAQGSSECSISLVVDAKDADDAVRNIHALIE